MSLADGGDPRLAAARAAAGAVTDPEIPVLTIEDLGILREVSLVRGLTVSFLCHIHPHS